MTMIVQAEAGAPYTQANSEYLAYVQMLALAGTYKPEQYRGRMYIEPANFPAADILWDAPPPIKDSLGAMPYGKPGGYIAVSYGQPSDGLPKKLPPVRKLTDIKECAVKWKFDLFKSGEGSALCDTFLYKPTGGLKKGDRALEMGVFAYACPAARAFLKETSVVAIRSGLMTDDFGQKWLTLKQGVYCMFIPYEQDAILDDSTINLKEMMDYLLGAGIATPDMRFPGTAFGIEPSWGAGIMKLTDFNVNYS